MAKLEIFNSKQAVQQSNTPRTSTLALPLSLATQQGQGINAITKSIADIQKDLYKIEDETQINDAKLPIDTKLTTEYTKFKNSTDILNGPSQFEKTIDQKNFQSIWKDKSIPVQRALKNYLNERKTELVPKLVGQISTNVSDKFLIDIGKNFDTAISLMVSSDQSSMARGQIMFDNLVNNQGYAGVVGYDEYQKLIKTKTNLRNKILLNSTIRVDPEGVLENIEDLREAVGNEDAERHYEAALQNLVDKRVTRENKERLTELQEQESQIGTFTEVLIRIDNAQSNLTDENLQNEMPTVGELYRLYEDGFLNEPMFLRLSSFLSDPEKDGLTDQELFDAITVQLYSAKTVQALADIKNNYLIDNDLLVEMGIQDISAFTAIIDKGKKDWKSHKEYSHYSKMIDKNIAMITFTGYEAAQEKAEIATRKQEILQSYTKKVLNGMSPRDAYGEVVLEEFDDKAVPKLNLLSFPVKNVNWSKALTDDPNYFETVQNQIMENFKNIKNKTVADGKNLVDDLEKVSFVSMMYKIRYAVAPVNPDLPVAEQQQQKFDFATTQGTTDGTGINFK